MSKTYSFDQMGESLNKNLNSLRKYLDHTEYYTLNILYDEIDKQSPNQQFNRSQIRDIVNSTDPNCYKIAILRSIGSESLYDDFYLDLHKKGMSWLVQAFEENKYEYTMEYWAPNYSTRFDAIIFAPNRKKIVLEGKTTGKIKDGQLIDEIFSASAINAEILIVIRFLYGNVLIFNLNDEKTYLHFEDLLNRAKKNCLHILGILHKKLRVQYNSSYYCFNCVNKECRYNKALSSYRFNDKKLKEKRFMFYHNAGNGILRVLKFAEKYVVQEK